MKILLEKLEKLERAEELANRAEADYISEPENEEFEKIFDRAYQNEFAAYDDLAKYIVQITSGEIDEKAARRLIHTKRNELKSLLQA